MLLGSQIYNKNILKEIKDVYKNGGNVIQLFLRKMCSSSKKDRVQLTEKEIKEIKKFIKDKKIKSFAHGSYLLNFCRVPVGLIRIKWAYEILHEDMLLGEKLGLTGVVIHMCSQNAVDEKWKLVKLSLEETIKRSIQHINYYFKNYSTKKIKLLLEISSSEGGKIGGNLKDFGKVFKPLYKKHKEKIGVCIDTCHAFASGYPLNTLEGMVSFFEDYEKYVGDLNTIELIHLNDSKDVLGSKKDRHYEIGKGHIFKKSKESLKYLLDFATKNKIPMCLETNAGYKREFKLLNNLNQKGGKKDISVNKITKILEEFYEIHKSLGNSIKAIQYFKAIDSIKNSGITKIEKGDELLHLDFVGKGIVSKIDEYIKNGKIKILEEFRKNPVIMAHRELTTVYGIGPKKAKELISNGILSIKDLKEEDLTELQKVGLKYYDDLKKRISRKEAEEVKKIIEKSFEGKVVLAGSYYRGKKTLGDIDIVLVSNKNNLKKVINNLKKYLIGSLGKNIKNSYSGLIKVDKNPVRHIDIHMVKEEDLPFHMLYFASGELFSRKIRKKAKEKGYKLNEKGLYKNNKKLKLNIDDVYKLLDIIT
jgi:apurinic endonuclease APN1